jgi:hypothetical protein
MLSCSANGICAICSILTKNITTRLGRTCRCRRTRRFRVPSRPSVTCWRCQFWADCTTNISGRKFPTGTAGCSRHRTECDVVSSSSRGGNSLIFLPLNSSPALRMRGFFPFSMGGGVFWQRKRNERAFVSHTPTRVWFGLGNHAAYARRQDAHRDQ